MKAPCKVGHTMSDNDAMDMMRRIPAPWNVRASMGLFIFLSLAPMSDVNAAWREPVEASYGILAAASPLATQAGESILEAGGNAVDAAVAIGFVLGVVEPWSSGVGGGGFMVVHMDGKTRTWDFRERAPGAATRDMFLKDGRVEKGASTWSARAAGIPGFVRGMVKVHQTYGRLPLSKVMAPAIALADKGLIVSQRFHRITGLTFERLNASAKRIFLDRDGKPKAVGSRLVQKDMARTLKAIVRSKGEAFYTGKIAKALVEAVNSEGGIWTQQDLADYVVTERDPVRGTYRGYDVVSMGPPSSGGLLLVQMLSVLEGFDLKAKGVASAETVHVMTESMKRAFAMRATGLADPDFSPVKREDFIGKDVIDRLGKEVRGAKKATPADRIARVKVRPEERTDTSHFGVLMQNGDAVACTQTINLRFGNGRVAGKTGVVLNNEMDDFAIMPGAPNAFGLVGDEANSVKPGKRPLSSMTPTILLKDGKAVGVFGSPGGSRIITTTLQTIINRVEHGMNVSQAVGAPRIHHQWFPDVLQYEAFGLSPDTMRLLNNRGHALKRSRPMGNGMVLFRRDDGVLEGAADPRGEGSAAAASAP
jgi:gamma-glutamyltranspeptidase/glutathione hydrolase